VIASSARRVHTTVQAGPGAASFHSNQGWPCTACCHSYSRGRSPGHDHRMLHRGCNRRIWPRTVLALGAHIAEKAVLTWRKPHTLRCGQKRSAGDYVLNGAPHLAALAGAALPAAGLRVVAGLAVGRGDGAQAPAHDVLQPLHRVESLPSSIMIFLSPNRIRVRLCGSCCRRRVSLP